MTYDPSPDLLRTMADAQLLNLLSSSVRWMEIKPAGLWSIELVLMHQVVAELRRRHHGA